MQIQVLDAIDITKVLSEDEINKAAPFLTSIKGISCKSNYHINAILRDIHSLSKAYKEKEENNEDLLSFQAQNGKQRKMICLPRTTTEQSFKVSAARDDLIDSIVEGLSSNSNSIVRQLQLGDDGEVIEDLDDGEDGDGDPIIAQLIAMLGKKNEAAFNKASKLIGLAVANKQLTPEEFTAMLQDANLSANAGKVIRQHLLSHGYSICPTAASVRKPGSNAILPSESGVTEHEERQVPTSIEIWMM